MRRLRALALATFGVTAPACALLVDTDELSGTARRGDAGGPRILIDAPDTTPDSEGGVTDARRDATEGGDAQGGPCPAAPSDSSLVAWFPFEETDSQTVLDCSGHGLDGTLTPVGTFQRVAGRSGMGVDFGGTAGCFDLGLATALAFGSSPFTVAAWIKPRVFSYPAPDGGSDPKPRWFFGHINRGSASKGWGIGTDSTSQIDSHNIEFKFFDSSGNFPEAESSVVIDQWVHVAGVFTPGSIKLYLYGGLLVTTAVGTSPGIDVDAHGWLGCRTPDEPAFDGSVDDVRVYSRALDDPEIAALAQ
jgi:arabinan endo-1,5-alpha-L-arabinosidase